VVQPTLPDCEHAILPQRACFQGTLNRGTSKDRRTAMIVIGMWQAVGQGGIMFQRHRGNIRGRAVNRRPEHTAVGKMAGVEGGTETAPTTAKVAEASALLY
jgi:hypothetical protein